LKPVAVSAVDPPGGRLRFRRCEIVRWNWRFELDEQFRGTQSLANRIQDLESELWNAGLQVRQFLTARIALCEEGLRRFRSNEGLMTESRRRALAESYFELGEVDKAEALYRKWLDADPCWGWGWIGWSDCYRFTRTERQDWNRCEQSLRLPFTDQ
jgi:hypothetical protein